MESTNWIQYVTAFSSLATPLLVLALTAVGWKYKQSFERKLKLEEKLRGDRIEIYNKILEPFILFMMSNAAWESDKKNKGRNKDEVATAQMLTLEYRQTSSNLSLIGSDEVVIAFSNLMQFFYNQHDSDDFHLRDLLILLGKFLLEIRKSMGNEFTKIDEWRMLDWFITDARKIRDRVY